MCKYDQRVLSCRRHNRKSLGKKSNLELVKHVKPLISPMAGTAVPNASTGGSVWYGGGSVWYGGEEFTVQAFCTDSVDRGGGGRTRRSKSSSCLQCSIQCGLKVHRGERVHYEVAPLRRIDTKLNERHFFLVFFPIRSLTV